MELTKEDLEQLKALSEVQEGKLCTILGRDREKKEAMEKPMKTFIKIKWWGWAGAGRAQVQVK